MNQSNSPLSGLFDVLADELRRAWSQERAEDIVVSWDEDSQSQLPDPIYSSWTLSIDSGTQILIGGAMDTLIELCELDALGSPDDVRAGMASCFTSSVQQTIQQRFGLDVTCTDGDDPSVPPAEWTSAKFTIKRQQGIPALLQVVVSPALESALGGPEDGEPTRRTSPEIPPGIDANSVEILMDVEMPVSIGLGRAKMHLKELLHLTKGSVVELDQELGDEVEIRVNNHVVAYGEVVAVDEYYAVRVLRMAIPKDVTLRGILREKVA